MEQACRARAEEVCTRLSAEYEAKLAEVNNRLKELHVSQCVSSDAPLLNPSNNARIY